MHLGLPRSLLFLPLLLSLTAAVAFPSLTTSFPPTSNVFLPSDAVSLLSFKSKADLDNKLLYALNERFDYCQWQGVKCAQGRVVRLALQDFGLRGVFPPDTLTRLDQLRVLSLNNNSLSGPVPDLSGLFNLKSLFLGRNFFYGAFPPSILFLHRLRTLDLSYDNFSGPIPVGLTYLDRLNSLRLESNRFNGTLPPFNQSFLLIFNVSGNNLTGPIPATPTLSRFGTNSFLWNSGLCGEILDKACSSRTPFFDSPNTTSPTSQPLVQSASQGLIVSPPSSKKHKKTGLILGVSIGVSIMVTALLCLLAISRTNRTSSKSPSKPAMSTTDDVVDTYPTYPTYPTISTSKTEVREDNELVISKPKTIEVVQRAQRSGNLVFCFGEAQLYSLEQLMRASAELLGRGSIGTTYKAVLDNQLIVTVKRLDAGKTAVTSSEAFERHMEAMGGLRHPNLVQLRAYFQAKGERLVIYEYQPNGSLYNLIHGKSRA